MTRLTPLRESIFPFQTAPQSIFRTQFQAQQEFNQTPCLNSPSLNFT